MSDYLDKNMSSQKEIELLLIIQKKFISVFEKRDRIGISQEPEINNFYP